MKFCVSAPNSCIVIPGLSLTFIMFPHDKPSVFFVTKLNVYRIINMIYIRISIK